MLPVEIVPIKTSLVLRARGSELLILPQHVKALKDRPGAKDFSQYFMGEALINRPARKLFEAWLRKDQTVWRRLYDAIKEMDLEAAEAEGEDVAPAKPAAKAAKEEASAPEKAKPMKAKAEEKAAPAKEAKKVEKKAEAKPEKKAAAAPKKAVAVKPTKAAPAKKAPVKPKKKG